MSTRIPVLADGTEVRNSPATARLLLFGVLAALSAGAAAIHFAVTFEHFIALAFLWSSSPRRSWPGRGC
jgi:hypothetical protein